MTKPQKDSARAARDAFLEAYKADLEADRRRTLEEYQSRFPGHEASIANEWRWLEPATLDDGPIRPPQPVEQKIGAYRIVEELGRGAQATVYLAEHETLRRQVALKVLRAPLTDGTSMSEQRFRREAEVTASIEHPNICSVYEAGTSDGRTWIAMQHVPGSTLAAHLADSLSAERETVVHLPVDDAESDSGTGTGAASSSASTRSDVMRVVAFAEQAARALHVAHERGLVHRDVKPGNLMVTSGGQPVILDFGLARAVDREGPGLTQSDDVLGTPYYMAPEQLRGETNVVDRRADVYALGVTLFECLTRQRPFHAVSVEALYQQILTVEPPAPRSINPQIPRDLEVVLLTAIEKDRARRYQTALDFAEDLRRVRQHEPIRAKPISSLGRVVRLARRHPGVAASLSLAVVSLAAGLIVSLLFLQGANRALGEKDVAVAALEKEFADSYTGASKAATRADVRGEVSDKAAQLRRRAERILDTEAPDLGARIRGLHDTPGAGRNIVLIGEILRDARRLGAIEQAAVADLIAPKVRKILAFAQFRSTPELEEQAVNLVKLQVASLHSISATDERMLRARILLLDGMNQLPKPRFDEAKELAEKWLKADVDSGAPRDPLRVALYESRLGSSLFGLDQRREARDMLERSVPKVVTAYPHTWYSNVAMANLLVVRDKLTSPEAAAPYRREFQLSLAASANYRHITHVNGYALRVAWGPSRERLWTWGARWSRNSRRQPLSESDVDRLEAELHELRNKLNIDSSDAALAGVASHFAGMANSQSGYGLWRPVVGRLCRLAIQGHETVGPMLHCSNAAPPHRRYGQHLLARGDYAGAEESFRRAVDLCRQDLWVRSEFEGLLGWCLAQRGEYELAEVNLLQAIRVAEEWDGPALASHLGNLAKLYRMWGRLDEAVPLHRRAIARSGRPVELRSLVLTYLQYGRLAEARAATENQAQRPGLRAHIDLLQGELDAAITQAKTAAARGNRGAQRVWAQALLRRGDAAASIAHFEKGAIDPRTDGSGFWSDYGAALVAAKDSADAGRTRLKQLTDERGGDPLAWHARARFLAATEGLTAPDRQKAVECAETANRLCKRRRAFVLAMLAAAQFQAGDKANARKTADEVEKLMGTRDAEWLSLEQFSKQRAKY